MRKAFFFDRDGTLNKTIRRYEEHHGKYLDCAPINISEFEIFEKAKEAVDFVRSKGFLPIVITNQPDFMRKEISLKNYEEITKELCDELGLSRQDIFECFHAEEIAKCSCRKPGTGLIFMAQKIHDIDLSQSWIVGDSWRDIALGEATGIKNTAFIKVEKSKENEGNIESLEKMNKLKIQPKNIISSIIDLKKLI